MSGIEIDSSDKRRRLEGVISSAPVRPLRRGVIASVTGLLAISGMLAIRRLVGAFDEPAPGALMAATAVLTAGVVFAGRIIWLRTLSSAGARDLAVVRLIGWTGTLALWLLAFGCAAPATRALDWVVWLPLLVADHLVRELVIARAGQKDSRVRAKPAAGGRERRPTQIADQLAQAPHANGPASAIARTGAGIAGADPVGDRATDFPADDAERDEIVLQELVRLRDAAGAESVRGTMLADFAPGQRHAVLHAGFCPPLERLPVVEAEAVDGPDAMVKVVQAFAHGARLEVRLAETCEEACTVTVELSAIPAQSANGTRMKADLTDIRRS
jgi:hypothetical protein